MNIFDSYTTTVLHRLLEAGIEFIIVGGYAVNYYGYTRTTGDIDLWIRPENGQQKEKLLEVFKALGVNEPTIQQLRLIDFSKTLVFSDGVSPNKIDFLTRVSGVEFDEAIKKIEYAEFDGMNLPFISYHDLILSKMSSSRGKDKVDVEFLQKINKEKNNE